MRYLVYGDEPAGEVILGQFKEAEFNNRTRTSTAFKHYFECLSGITPTDAKTGFTHAEFLKTLCNREGSLVDDLMERGVGIRTLSQKVWLFFFMQDRQDAVFSFEDIGAAEESLAFRTRDATLVETFGSIFDRYWGSALQREKGHRLDPLNTTTAIKAVSS